MHQLDDSDHLALVLDRQHQRRLHARRLVVGQLAHVPLAVDVVVDARRVLDLLRHVVLEQRLAAHDHAALHAAAVAVQRQRRQDRRVELPAVDPREVAADQLRLGVERGDDHAVVRHGLGEQLAEAVVDALELERLVQITRCRQQQLGFLGPPMTAHVSFIMPPMFEGLATRLEGRLVVLEPVTPEHEDGLRAAAADERTWRWMLTRDVDLWVADVLRPQPDRQPFAVLRDGEVIGSTSYLALAPEHRRLEIGNTWLNPSAWGTGANTEAKYLLLRRRVRGARLPARRVQDGRAERPRPRGAGGDPVRVRGDPPLAHGRPRGRAARLGLVRGHGRDVAGDPARARSTSRAARLRPARYPLRNWSFRWSRAST